MTVIRKYHIKALINIWIQHYHNLAKMLTTSLVLITVENHTIYYPQKMGTHLWKNGYYFLEKWVPISYMNGYPFLDYIVLSSTKYSGNIKGNDLWRLLKILRSRNLNWFQKELLRGWVRRCCYRSKKQMLRHCFLLA